MISMIEAGNVRTRRGGKHEVKVEGVLGGEQTEDAAWGEGKEEKGGGKLFTHCSDSQALPMKNAWNISQEHNYLHGSEDWSGACNPP